MSEQEEKKKQDSTKIKFVLAKIQQWVGHP